jgi:hypothetical protein
MFTRIFFEDRLAVQVDARVNNRLDGREEPVGGGTLAVESPE